MVEGTPPYLVTSTTAWPPKGGRALSARAIMGNKEQAADDMRVRILDPDWHSCLHCKYVLGSNGPWCKKYNDFPDNLGNISVDTQNTCPKHEFKAYAFTTLC